LSKVERQQSRPTCKYPTTPAGNDRRRLIVELQGNSGGRIKIAVTKDRIAAELVGAILEVAST